MKATVESFVPKTKDFAGADTLPACYGVVPNAIASGGKLPILSNPIAQYDSAAKRLYACGQSSVTTLFECYSYDKAGAVWTKITLQAATFNANSFSNTYLWFIYNAQVWIADDVTPKILDLINPGKLVQNYWDTSTNLPTMPNSVLTNGEGCVANVGDFAYWFAKGIVRQFYLKGLGAGITGSK